MTISSTNRKAGPFVGSGSTDDFPFAFKVFSSADLYVVKLNSTTGVETVLALTTDYTVALNADQNANPGGTVTLVAGNLATGYTLTITSNLSPLQQTDLTNQGGFYPSVITNALDKLTILVQQLLERAGRALTLPLSVTGVSADLPVPVANSFLGWNTLGTAIINYAGLASATVSSAMQPVVAAATLALGRAALGISAFADGLVTAADSNAARATLGIDAALQAQTATAFTTAGSAPAFTLTPTPAITAYAPNQRFRVKFNAAGTTGSNTLNISGQGVKNLKQYDGAGNKVPAVITANLLADVECDGTDLVVLTPLSQSPAKLQQINATVAANALTISAGSLTLDFRSTTLGSGAVTTVSGAPANLVISSGSTLGTVNGQQSRIAVIAMNNAGTIELAAVNISGGNQLDETNLISTTAEGGAGAADSANVIYSTTARSNLAYRVIGYVESTQATAGTWATAPSTIQGAGGQALAALSSLGYGQTWQSVTRTSGTTYYNTTGKPIVLNVETNGSSTTTRTTISVNGGTAVTMAYGSTPSGFAGGAGSAVIPPGASYVLTDTNVSGRSSWELR